MDAVAQSMTTTWLTSVATNPIAGSLGMLLLIIGINWLRPFLPFLPGGGQGTKPPPDPPTGHGWQVSVGETAEAAEHIVDALKEQVSILRRETEAIERIERALAIWLAHQDRGAPRAPSAPRRSGPPQPG